MCCCHNGPSQCQSNVVHQRSSLSSKTENQAGAFPLRDVLDWPRLAQPLIHPSRTETTNTRLGSPSLDISLLLISEITRQMLLSLFNLVFYYLHRKGWFGLSRPACEREPLLILFLPRAFSFSSRIGTKSCSLLFLPNFKLIQMGQRKVSCEFEIAK